MPARSVSILRFASVGLALALAAAACSSSDSSNPEGAGGSGGTGGTAGSGGMAGMDGSMPDSTTDGAAAMCASPGQATPGPADMHCMADDGGMIAQPTSQASCMVDSGGPDGGDDTGCDYGATMFGMEGDDDDCKYHVKWTAGDLCEGSGGVPFTVVVTNKTDGSPATGAGTMAEVFTTTPGDAACDDQSTHPGPNSGVMLTEGPSGTYTGSIQFDQSGQWTVRFHMYHDCLDVLEDSPHGHAAFHLTLP